MVSLKLIFTIKNQGTVKHIKLNLKSETVGGEDGLDLDMLIDQETAFRMLSFISFCKFTEI